MAEIYKPYTAKSGKRQYMPSNVLLQDMDDECQGFCLACGNVEDSVEPDAAKYVCSTCGSSKVYGTAELAMLGLYYNEGAHHV